MAEVFFTEDMLENTLQHVPIDMHMNTATIRISRLHQLKSESFVEFFCLDTMKFHMYQITGQRILI